MPKLNALDVLDSTDCVRCLHHLCAQGLVSWEVLGKVLLSIAEVQETDETDVQKDIILAHTLFHFWEEFKVNRLKTVDRLADKNDSKQIERPAHTFGWEEAQNCVACGLVMGDYGFTQNPAELVRLAKLGWVEAQYRVARGLATGGYGFTKDLNALRRLAFERNWKSALCEIEKNGDKYGPLYPEALSMFEHKTKNYTPAFANTVLNSIPSAGDKLAFALHMACLEHSRRTLDASKS